MGDYYYFEIDPPCVCCNLANQPPEVVSMCVNPFYDDGYVDGTSDLHHKPEIDPMYLALPALSAVGGISLLLSDFD